jgi:integrase
VEDRITVQLLSPGKRAYFCARWVPPGGRRYRYRSLRTADPEAAERLRSDLEYELNHGLHGAAGAPLSWAELRAMYAAERLAGRREATRRKAGYVFDRFEALSRPGDAAAVDERLLSAHAVRLRRSGLKAVTAATHLAHLRACLRWAARQRLISRAPTVEMPKVPALRQIRTVDAAGLEALLAACPSEGWRLLVLTAWHSGLRRAELAALTWDGAGGTPWPDLARRRLWLPAEFTKADGDQWVPLHSALLAELEAARRPAGRVFALSRSLNEVSRTFGQIARRAGLAVTLHDLRRSFGSRYARTVEAAVLRRLMRHADLRTTLAYYADVDGALHDAIERG